MGRISGLSEDLLVKILSFLPTKNAVSTSVLSKQWEFLWTWLPKLEYDMSDSESKPVFRDFVNKTLPLHRAPVIDSFSLEFDSGFIQRDDLKLWAGIVVSRCVRELSICCSSYWSSDAHVLPSSLYTCKSLVTLILEDVKVFVDVPRMVSLPSLKTLKLRRVTYLNEDSLGLFLSYCPVLEDLVIDRRKDDNMRALVVDVPSLQRLSLDIDEGCSSDDEYVVGTPLLKYFKVNDVRCSFHYLIEHMPKLEEADINVLDDIGKLLKSVTTVKRLSLYTVLFQGESACPDGIVFNQLEHLELNIDYSGWQDLLLQLLEDSPTLRVLTLKHYDGACEEDEETFDWNNNSVPKCLLESLEKFKFEGYDSSPDQRDFLSFLFKNACCLKSSSISDRPW